MVEMEKRSHVNDLCSSHEYRVSCMRIKILYINNITPYTLTLGLITLNVGLWLMWGIHICLVFKHFCVIKCQVGHVGAFRKSFPVIQTQTRNCANSDMTQMRIKQRSPTLCLCSVGCEFCRCATMRPLVSVNFQANSGAVCFMMRMQHGQTIRFCNIYDTDVFDPPRLS